MKAFLSFFFKSWTISSWRLAPHQTLCLWRLKSGGGFVSWSKLKIQQYSSISVYPISVFLFDRRKDKEQHSVQPWAVCIRVQRCQLPVRRWGEQWGVQPVSLTVPSPGFHSIWCLFLMLILFKCILIIRYALWNTSSICFHVLCTFPPLRFTFIKNIPNQSRAVSALRDIPPKTRSTPTATMVLDLVSFAPLFS